MVLTSKSYFCRSTSHWTKGVGSLAVVGACVTPLVDSVKRQFAVTDGVILRHPDDFFSSSDVSSVPSIFRLGISSGLAFNAGQVRSVGEDQVYRMHCVPRSSWGQWRVRKVWTVSWKEHISLCVHRLYSAHSFNQLLGKVRSSDPIAM